MSCTLDLLHRIESDATLRTRFESAATRDEVLALMAANGCNCTVEALEKAVERRRQGEMSESELGAIAGGAGVADNLTSLLTVLNSFK